MQIGGLEIIKTSNLCISANKNRRNLQNSGSVQALMKNSTSKWEKKIVEDNYNTIKHMHCIIN